MSTNSITSYVQVRPINKVQFRNVLVCKVMYISLYLDIDAGYAAFKKNFQGGIAYPKASAVDEELREKMMKQAMDGLSEWGKMQGAEKDQKKTKKEKDMDKKKADKKEARENAVRKKKQDKDKIKEEKKEESKSKKVGKKRKPKKEASKTKEAKAKPRRRRARVLSSSDLSLCSSSSSEVEEQSVSSSAMSVHQWRRDASPAPDVDKPDADPESVNYSMDDLPVKSYVAVLGKGSGGEVEAWVGQVHSQNPKKDCVRISYLEPEIRGAPVGRWQRSKTNASRVSAADVQVSQVIAIITSKDFINDWMMSSEEWAEINCEAVFFSKDIIAE